MTTAITEKPAAKVVSPEEWIVARKQLLAKETEFTRLRDELSRKRRDLPWEKVEMQYVFEGTNGKETLADLFDGRGQLIVYHFMFGPGWKEGCPSCSFLADSFDGAAIHLAHDQVGHHGGDPAIKDRALARQLRDRGLEGHRAREALDVGQRVLAHRCDALSPPRSRGHGAISIRPAPPRLPPTYLPHRLLHLEWLGRALDLGVADPLALFGDQVDEPGRHRCRLGVLNKDGNADRV